MPPGVGTVKGIKPRLWCRSPGGYLFSDFVTLGIFRYMQKAKSQELKTKKRKGKNYMIFTRFLCYKQKFFKLNMGALGVAL